MQINPHTRHRAHVIGYGDPCDEVIWKWLLEELKKRRAEKEAK